MGQLNDRNLSSCQYSLNSFVTRHVSICRLLQSDESSEKEYIQAISWCRYWWTWRPGILVYSNGLQIFPSATTKLGSVQILILIAPIVRRAIRKDQSNTNYTPVFYCFYKSFTLSMFISLNVKHPGPMVNGQNSRLGLFCIGATPHQRLSLYKERLWPPSSN